MKRSENIIKINVEYLSRPADIEIKGLKIWVHDWQFPVGTEGDDEDWLHVTALYEAKNAVVWREGNFIESHRIGWLMNSIKNRLLPFSNLAFGDEAAHLQCDEPYFGFYIEYIHLPPSDEDVYGVGESLSMVVDITPDHNEQSHRFSESISFDDLITLLAQFELVIEKFPTRISG